MARLKIGDNPSVRAAFEGAGLKIVDIGARGGPPRELRLIGPFSDFFAFEPDVQAAEILAAAEKLQSDWRRVTVVPKAVASVGGQATLYVTAGASSSSLLEPDPDVAGRFECAPALEVVSRIQVPSITLDAAAAEYDFEDACFLKLDTQGAELDILHSGVRLLERAVVGVYIESIFHPFYKGQSLFADNDEYLRRNGFFLVDLRRGTQRALGYHDDVRSLPQVAWANSLYLRHPSELATRPQEEAARLILRYFLIAIAYHQFDLAMNALTQDPTASLLAGATEPSFPDEAEKFIRLESNRLLPEQ